MKNINAFWDGLKNYIYKHYGQESGKMLVHVGIITWATSSLAQIFAIAVNNKIPAEQKKFLIPQEIADGAINVLTFYIITNSIRTVASKLVSTGKWSNEAIRSFVAKKAPRIKMGDLSTNLSEKFKENKEFHDSYDTFKGGMEMMAASVGSVASCNAITPFIRNSWGAKKQKESINREKLQTKTVLYNPNRNSMKI